MSSITSVRGGFADIYDIAGGCVGMPSASGIVLHFVMPTAWRLPTTGHYARAHISATSTATFTIYKNGVSIGTFEFAAGGTSATFSIASAIDFAVGDYLMVKAPTTQDATLADVAITFKGRLI